LDVDHRRAASESEGRISLDLRREEDQNASAFFAFSVIASEAIQIRHEILDCFVAEPVIGPRGACHRARIRATRWRGPVGSSQ
jgi:hypothetical protein